MVHDWHQFHADGNPEVPVVDSQRRLKWCLGIFILLLAIVFVRAVQLEVTQGAAFRREATKPLVRRRSVPGVRGRILARDGSVLAHDKQVLAVAVHYRRFEEPVNPTWLRRRARSRLSRQSSKDPRQVAAEEARVKIERIELARRLADLCGIAPREWQRRTARIQSRVRRISSSVNRRASIRQTRRESPEQGADSFVDRLRQTLSQNADSLDEKTSRPLITVAEELDFHVVAEDIPLAVAAEIESNPQQYPGVKIVQRTRRFYPANSLAAHVLGYLGPLDEDELNAVEGTGRRQYHPEDLVGRAGVERRYENLLRGKRGEQVETTNRAGTILSTYRQREPGIGRDLVLTIDPRLQRSAAKLLDEALARRSLDATSINEDSARLSGGAIIIMDVRSGELLVADSAPRFTPNVFLGGTTQERAALLTGQDHPLFNRAIQMAIPPGSVFKTITAVSLLEAGAIDATDSFYCQGYLQHPDRQRCAIYRRHGIGHGETTLIDALTKSCNVYFFHHVDRIGPNVLVDWASRFGLGRTTGIDLPGEADGNLPSPADLQGDGLLQSLSIGQGALTTTPLQIARMTAALANGGQLVTPHVVARVGLRDWRENTPPPDDEDPIRFPGAIRVAALRDETIRFLQLGLERAVSDSDGTAHNTLFLRDIAIAAKTGTAQAGGTRADHAWLAAYVPADRPQFVLVVALEHAGKASAAGAVVKRLVLRMRELDML